MLEIVQVLSQKTPFAGDIVFNFNGAEETGLQGAHAFITQHPWAKEYSIHTCLQIHLL